MREWQAKLRTEQRSLERQIQEISRGESKVLAEIKKSLLAGRGGIAKILAKEIVVSRSTKNRLWTAKTNLNSVSMQLGQQSAMLKMTNSVKGSNELMRCMHSCMQIPQIAETMQTLSREMLKAGMLEEAIQESFDSESLEEEAEQEVETLIEGIIKEINLPQKARPTAAVKAGATGKESVVSI